MSDVLSQNEIDDLLASINSGDIGDIDNLVEPELVDKIIKEYDFEKPPKFNKEQLKTLEIIFDNFARTTSSYLTGYLRMSTQIEVSSAEQIIFKEFSNSLQNPVIVGIVDFSPLKGSIILELSSGIGYAIIDRILGGMGIPMDNVKNFSDIERMLINRVISNIIKNLIEPWENIVSLKPYLEKVETDAQFAQIISPNEMVALVSLKISIGDVVGFINFCIPHIVIEPVIKKLNNKYWFSSNQDDKTDSYKDALEERLEKTNLNISAILGKTFISVNEFIDLKVGDVITLDSFIDSDIKICVSNNMKFYGRPGIVKNRNSIQITGFIGKDDN